ncbi:MAG: trypsin-like peptidase domain-containing protein [Proteobacteria bacterium]|nr:trypsin-like peptidase domain-containing protein [Pseudomonadota bacterium]
MTVTRVFAALALVAAAGTWQGARAETLSEINTRVRPEIVLLTISFESKETGEIKTAEASGFVLNPDGFVGTVNHAVAARRQELCKGSDGCRVAIKGRLGTRASVEIPLDIIETNESVDQAVLKFRSLPTQTLQGLPLGNPAAVAEGDAVYAFGFPLGKNMQPRDGTVTGKSEEHGRWNTNLAINPGDSGGPVTDARGLVVGQTGGGYTETANLNYMIPINLSGLITNHMRQATPSVPKPAPQSASSSTVSDGPVPQFQLRRFPLNISGEMIATAADFEPYFQKWKTDELKMSFAGQGAFAVSDYGWTVRFLRQAKLVESSGVWGSSRPFLIGAYCALNDGAKATEEIEGLLSAIRADLAKGYGFLRSQTTLGFVTSNLGEVRAAIGNKCRAELDTLIDQVIALKGTVPN